MNICGDFEESPKCAVCYTSSLLRCTKCKTVFYCSTNHQHLDWPKHKKECRILAHQQNFINNSTLSQNQMNHQQQQSQIQQQQNHQISSIADFQNMSNQSNYHNQRTQIMNNSEIIDSISEMVSPPSSPPYRNYHDTQNDVLTSNQQHQGNNFSDNSCKIGENFFSSEKRYEELCRNIVNDMNNFGLSVVDDFLGMEKGLQILNEVHKMYAAGVFQDGQVVSHSGNDQNLRTIRGDKITWVKGTESGCTNIGYLINQIDAVVCLATRMLNNGILGSYDIKERTKAMVACYPGSGSHYVMHVDNPNKDGRIITAIYYLNLNWDTKRSGGILRIFPENGETVADIEPKFDRIIFFWSDRRNPHEVQPAHRTRYAITVWYFDANERLAALNRCKKYGNDASCL